MGARCWTNATWPELKPAAGSTPTLREPSHTGTTRWDSLYSWSGGRPSRWRTISLKSAWSQCLGFATRPFIHLSRKARIAGVLRRTNSPMLRVL